MRVRLQLLLVALISSNLLPAATANASDPDTPSGTTPISVFEDGFEVFVGCGDGLKLGDEECDDNNQVDGDGCDSDCTVEDGYSCLGEPSVCVPD